MTKEFIQHVIVVAGLLIAGYFLIVYRPKRKLWSSLPSPYWIILSFNENSIAVKKHITSYESGNDWLVGEPVYKIVLFLFVMLVAAAVIKVISLFDKWYATYQSIPRKPDVSTSGLYKNIQFFFSTWSQAHALLSLERGVAFFEIFHRIRLKG